MFASLAAAAVAAAANLVPPALAVPSPATLTLQTEGRGVQIYTCAPRSDQPGAYAWTLKGPEAELYGYDGLVIGRHSAGPAWEDLDGGRIVGQVVAQAPSPDPAAIDWLLLSVKSANGAGVLGKTTYVRRIHTTGGRAPEDGCSSRQVGAEARAPYVAEYDFYADRASSAPAAHAEP